MVDTVSFQFMFRNPLLNRVIESNRSEKYLHFINTCAPKATDKILDVGVENRELRGSENVFEKSYPHPENVTGLGITTLDGFSKKYPKVKAITYDGRTFPFEDNSFDIVWCNAVIEHVGNSQRQGVFLSEMIRTARKKVYFTTPSRGFPIESHTITPFIHWLPKQAADRIYVTIKRGYATGDYMHLLYESDVRALLEKVKEKFRFNYEIVKNKTLGLISTYSVIIEKEEKKY